MIYVEKYGVWQHVEGGLRLHVVGLVISLDNRDPKVLVTLESESLAE